MLMGGVTDDIKKIIEPVSRLSCISDYYLIGGTALSIQLNHRLSQDLDFCKWPLPGKSEIDWPAIQSELKLIFKTVEADILDFNQVNFLADKIKISFYANNMYRQPITKFATYMNSIRIPEIKTIGALKLEVMLRRSNFRDYYDLFAILKEGVSLKEIVNQAVEYSNHLLKTRDILNFISRGSNFRMSNEFALLKPLYDINEEGIEEFIRNIILQEFKSGK